MALVLKDKITLTTPRGVSEVQLLFGDITQLPLDEKVDAIIVSAFPGDYVTVPSTVIGALKRNLGVVVNDLVKNKELNLLHNFNCWVSKPLPDRVPFKRLVCFERVKSNEKLPSQISEIFRAMMPVFGNHDTSVITPLLAAGNQGYPEGEVLMSIVTAACHWINAGLSLKCLKIVVYLKNTHMTSPSDQKLLNLFTKMKKKFESKTIQQVDLKDKKYDVCMSFAAEDMELVSEICRCLKSVNDKMMIHSEYFHYNYESVWQEQIFKVMVDTRKIVAVLTPNYVKHPECMDQYNLALCCNRLSEIDVLAPFYVQTVDPLPSYMTIIQYTECRVRKEGEVKEEKITAACSLLVQDLNRRSQKPSETEQKTETTDMYEGTTYDIFISYAHRTPTEATLLYKILQAVDPNLKVFLDRSELRTGNIWQEALYEAVDKARLVVAFISQPYVQSSVCQEEYSIALARYLSQDGIFLVPVLTEEIEDPPAWLGPTSMVDLRDRAVREDSSTFSQMVTFFMHYLQTAGLHNHFNQPSETIDMVSVLGDRRGCTFHQRFEINEKDTVKLKPKPEDSHTKAEKSRPRDTENKPKESKPMAKSKTVMLSFSSDCFNQALMLSDLLRAQDSVSISVEFVSPGATSGTHVSQMQLLDSADMVVVFLSDSYMASAHHRDELHISLCRQRTTKDRPILYLIEAHHTNVKPVYSHLLPHSISLGDKLWFNQARTLHMLKADKTSYTQLPDGMKMRVYCSGLEYVALMTAAVDIADKLANGGGDGTSGMPTNIINLASAMRLGEEGKQLVDKSLVQLSSLKETKPHKGTSNNQDSNKGHAEFKASLFEDNKGALDFEEPNTALQGKALQELATRAQLEMMMDMESGDFDGRPTQKKSLTCMLL